MGGFPGVVVAVYLIGGFIAGGIALALQMVGYQFAEKAWVKTLPLKLGVALWVAMLLTRFVGVYGIFGGMVSALYTAFGGWVYPYDLVAFAMSTIPILAGLIVGLVVCRGKK